MSIYSISRSYNECEAIKHLFAPSYFIIVTSMILDNK